MYNSAILVNITIDNVIVKNCPYRLDNTELLEKRLREYVKENSYVKGYNDFYTLNIVRSKFFQSLEKKYPEKDFRGEFYISYENEEGIDAGGLKRDFFECLGTYAVRKNVNMFEKIGDHYRIHPDSDPKLMKIYGSAVANGIIHKFKVPISFCNSLLKILLEIPLQPSDLAKESPEVYDNLMSLTKYSDEDLQSSYLDFSVTQKKKIIPLKADGEKISVKRANLDEYINLMINWELTNYAKESINEFKKGFFEVSKPLKTLFSIEEFRYIMCGLDEDYISIFRDKIECYTAMEKYKRWIIRWLEERGLETVKMFLKFVTGSSLIPVDKSGWRIKISSQNNEDNLPVSHTCFFTIEIPFYKTYEILCEKLDKAIELDNDYFGLA